jgi:hypothetical protein
MNEIVPLRLQLFTAVSIGILVVWIGILLRANRLSLRDSLLWLLSTCGALIFALFPGVLVFFAHALGITVPVNAAFALGFLYVVANLITITLKTSSNSVALRRIAQEVGLLRAELDRVKEHGSAVPGPGEVR